MVYESEYSYRRPYVSSRPTLSTYSVTPYLDRVFYDDIVSSPVLKSSYFTPTIRILPTYSSLSGIGSYISRPSIRYAFDSEYEELPYHNIKRIVPVPMTRITTSPTRVYRERVSPMRIITPSARVYRRDVTSPVKVIQSPARVMSIRVRPSTLSREFDRIERKFRGSPVRDIDNYVNNSYANNFDDETREIRAASRRLLNDIHEPVKRAPSVSRASARAASVQPSNNYSKFDAPEYSDRYIDNEYHASKNILMPTRRTRDQIEILSKYKFREPAKRYSVGLKAKKDKHNDFDNKPLVIAKPIVLKDNKIQSVVKENDEVIVKKLESLALNETNDTAVVG
jgi:hypothetical protein